MIYLLEVTCPYCFQEFGVPCPAAGEMPCDVDYDCEVCCRPMRIAFELGAYEGDEPSAVAYSLTE